MAMYYELEAKIAHQQTEIERLRAALRKLIDEINNRDDLPTEEYEQLLSHQQSPKLETFPDGKRGYKMPTGRAIIDE